MHWKSWDKLCIGKDEGGLGFKDLSDFNTAMLGKQFWRLIEKPNSLFSRVFKGPYFQECLTLGTDLFIFSVLRMTKYYFY
ncbi:hypothetical protein Bca101_009676 [Brassica carinata]